jgi:hypothetical protein
MIFPHANNLRKSIYTSGLWQKPVVSDPNLSSARRHLPNLLPRAVRRKPIYLVGYDGVRVIDGDLESLRNGNDKCSDLYEAAQRVVTELRLITQEQQGERR